MLNNTNIIKSLFGLIFFIIFINNLKNYIEFKSEVSKNNPLSYSYIGKNIIRGGRGETYELLYQYRSVKGTVNITSIEYELIDDSNYPKLFISENTGIIFSMWELKKAFRLTILFLVLFIVTIIPWNKIQVRK